jgi:hypothetical protein
LHPVRSGIAVLTVFSAILPAKKGAGAAQATLKVTYVITISFLIAQLGGKNYHFSDMPAPLQVVIVGAGIGGLTCAIACRQQGLNVLVLEKATQILPVISHIGSLMYAKWMLMVENRLALEFKFLQMLHEYGENWDFLKSLREKVARQSWKAFICGGIRTGNCSVFAQGGRE